MKWVAVFLFYFKRSVLFFFFFFWMRNLKLRGIRSPASELQSSDLNTLARPRSTCSFWFACCQPHWPPDTKPN